VSKHRTRWTDEEKDTLRSLTREGHTYARIAEMIGRTEHAVNIMAYHLDLKHPRVKVWTAAELATAARLYHAGNTVHEIARILKRTPTGVSSTLTSYGVLDSRRRGYGRLKSEPQIYVLRKRGLMYREILLVLGREDSVSARKALHSWLTSYCARLGVEVPPASTPRKKPDLVLVESVQLEIASLTGSMGKYVTSMANQGRPARGAA
jgi:DNA-binding CsgD family transcriptional regulator